MKAFLSLSTISTFNLALSVSVIALSVGMANAAPLTFDDEFTGPSLDAAWSPSGDPNGHPTVIAGSYDITDAHGAPGVKLTRSTPGTLSTYTHEIQVVLDPFLLTGSGGTQTDFKWKAFGADGFMEFVLNSFGNMRLFHNDFSGGAGDIQPNTNLGLADGDLLTITTNYNLGTDTIDVTYSINGGLPQPYYSGGGIDGPVGDTITNFVEVEVFKWGSGEPTQALAAIDRWKLVEIPEPSSAMLFLLASLSWISRVKHK